jgi:hypothetical protein
LSFELLDPADLSDRANQTSELQESVISAMNETVRG